MSFGSHFSLILISSTDLRFRDRARGLLAAWPLNYIVSLGIPHGLAYVTSHYWTTPEGLMYFTFGTMMLIGLGTYLMNLDEYDLVYSFMITPARPSVTPP